MDPSAQGEPERYDGSWERGGRSISGAAFAGLLGIGILYFYGGSFMMVVMMAFTVGINGLTHGGEGYVQDLGRIVEATKTPLRVTLIVSQYLLMLVPVLWLVRRWHSSDVRSYIRFRAVSAGQVSLACAATILLFPLNLAISDFFRRSLNIPDALTRVQEGLFAAGGAGELAFVVFVIAVTPAICEEVLFRGYVQRTLERTLGWKSILVAGVVFGLYHMQPLSLLFLSALGFLFGFFYFASKSLVPGMAAHFANNAMAVSWLYVSRVAPGTSAWSGPAPIMIAAIVALPFAGLAVYVFWRVSRRAEEKLAARLIAPGGEG